MTDDDPPDIAPDEDDDAPPAADQPTVSAVKPPSRRAQARAGRDVREQHEFWTAVLASDIGRREIWRMLAAGHPFETRFGVGPNGFPQPEASWIHRGEQDLALRFFFTLQRIDPQGVLLMQTEHDPRFAKPRRARKEKDV